MQEKDQIAELFKDTFSNYEAPVRPELWQNIASQIQSPAAPSIPDGSAAVKITTAVSKITIAWVSSAVIMISAATGYYFYSNQQLTAVETPVTVNIPEERSEQLLPAPETISSADNLSENVKTNSPLNKSGTASNNLQIEKSQDQAAAPINSINPVAASTVTTASTGNNNSSQETVAESTSDKGADKINQVPASPVANSSPIQNAVKNKIQALPLSGPAPLAVNFTSPFSGDNEWILGDGTDVEKGTQVKHVYNEPGTYLVTVKNTDENGKTLTELIKIEVLSDLSITNIPNIFTPNGDGVNDEFKLNAGPGVAIEVSIFDKSGRFVHKFSGAGNSWNGKINNLQDAGEGTYFYVIFATGKNGGKNTQKGTITLKR